MADFSFDIPVAESGPTQVFEEEPTSFYDELQLPTGDASSPSRTAVMAQLANHQLDGTSEPIENYMGKAEGPDGEAILREEVSAKETAQAEQDYQDVLLQMVGEGTEDQFLDYMLQTTIGSTDMLKRTNLERQTAAFLSSSILADENSSGYFVDDEGNVDEDQLSMNEMWAAEALIWQGASQKLAKRLEDDGILANASDVLGLLLKPLGDDLAWAETIGTGEGEFFTDDIQAAQQKISQATGKERLALITEYTDRFLEMGNPIRALTMVDTLSGTLDWRGKLGHNFIEAAETLDLAAGLGLALKLPLKGMKALTTLSKASDIAKGAGARKVAVDLQAKFGEQAILNKNAGVEVVDEAVEGVLQSSLKKALGEGYVDTAGGVNASLERRVADFTSVLEDGILPSRLTPEEQAAAVLATTDKLRARAGNLATDLVDVQFVKEGRTQRVDMFIGTGPERTGTFITKEAAETAAVDSFHMKPGSFWVKDNGDGFFIGISRGVEEKGFIKPLEDTSKLGHGIPILKSVMGAASQQTREAHSAAILGQNTASRLQKLFNDATATLATLPGKGREEFVQFAQKLHEEERWMNVEEMKIFYKDQYGRNATAKDVDAYSNYILANDADYWVRNAKIRKEIVTSGYEGMSVNGEKIGIAKEATSIKGDIRTVSLFDMVEEKFYGAGSVTQEKIDRLIASDRFSLIEVPSGYRAEKGVAQYIVAPSRHVSVEKLPTRVLNYQAGGHRFYVGEHYAKQQNLFVGAEGRQFAGKPKTLYNFESVADANIFATKANKALEAFNVAKQSGNAGDIRRATEVIQREMPLWGGYGKVLEMVEDGALLKTPIEIIRTGKVPTTKGAIAIEQSSDLSDEVLMAMDQNKFWFQEKRGEHLRTIVDVANPRATTKAPILDPLGAMDRSVNSATRMFGFDDYKARQVDQWIKTYGAELTTTEGSPLTRLMSEDFAATSNLSATEIVKANAWRDAIKRTVGSLTADEKLVQQSMEGVIDYMDRTGKQKWAKVFRDANSKNPVTAVKGLVFDHFMALDPSQMFVQLSMLPGIIAVGGKNGLKSASSYSLLRMAMVNDSPQVLDRLAKTSKVVGGMEPAVFKSLWKDMKQSGVLNVMDTQADIATFGKASTFKSHTLAKANYYTDKVRHGARVFFNEAERGNKGISYATAWLENFEKTGKGITSTDEAALIAGRAEALAGNMTTASRANWQRGLMSLPTQFQAHPVRVMELLLTNNAGFKKADKIKFASGLAVAYGAGGIMPFGPEMIDSFKSWYTNNYGEPPSEVTIRGIRDGLLGAAMAGFEGVPNLDISRLQTFANSDNNLLFQALMGDKTFKEVMFGPSGSLGVKYMEDIQGALWIKGLFNGTVSFEDVPYLATNLAMEMAKNMAGVNRMTAAYILHSAGEIRDKKGRPIIAIGDPTWGQKVGASLGFPPIEVGETYDALMDKKAIMDTQDVYARNIVKVMRELRDLAIDPEADPEDIRKAKQRHRMWWDLVKSSAPDVQASAWQMQIASKAVRLVGKDEVLADNLADYFNKLNVKITETK